MSYDPEFCDWQPDKGRPGVRTLQVFTLCVLVAALLAAVMTPGLILSWLAPGPDAPPVPEGHPTLVPAPRPSAHAETPEPARSDSSAYHLIVNRDTGQCLDVPYGATEPRTRVEQFPVNGGTNQLWRIEPVVRDVVRIVNRHAGQCLDIPYGTPERGTAVEQYPTNGGSNQGWRLEPVGGHWYRIVNDHTGQCLEVPSGSSERRTAVVQAPISGRTDQHWRPIAVR